MAACSKWMKFRLFLIVLISVLGIRSTTGEELADGSGYVITAGNEQLHFVQRPDLGYVVQTRREEAAINALGGTLKQFGAKDIRRVGGLRRKGVSVVLDPRPIAENLSTIAALRAQNHIRYAAPLFSSNGQTVAIIPEIVVRVIPETDQGQLEALCQPLGLSIKERLEFTDSEYLVEVLAADADNVFQAVEKVKQAEIIEWAVLNVAFQPQLLGQVIPDDTYFPNQWHLNNTGQSGGTPDADIDAPEAWEITTGDPDIVVAVLDEGVDTDHPDLVNNIVAGYDFYDDDSMPDPSGDDAHGTACAGLIAGQGNNGIGITGVAWNCKIMPIRISGGGNYITESDVATAIRWSASHGADILSSSIGTNFALPVIHSAIQDVTVQGGIGREGKGCVLLAAAGNWVGGGPVMYPAKYAEVIAVGATDYNDQVWYYSASGSELDLVAPSGYTDLNGDIWTTDIAGSAGYNNRNPGILDYTDKMGGTSAACPIAAGVAALVLSVHPDLTNIDVQDILQSSAVDFGPPGFDIWYGYGRVDAVSALLSPKQQWMSRYNGPGNSTDYARALAVDGLGNVYVTGRSYGIGTDFDYATIKYDPDGNQLWVKRYNGPGNSYDSASALAVDGLGNVYVTGSIVDLDIGIIDYATIKYDSNGNELWIKRYNGPGNSYDEAYALAVDGLGNVYVTGRSYGIDTDEDYATIKYDPDGNELWVKRYNGPGIFGTDYACALAVDGLGNVYVTGQSLGSETWWDYDYATVKYDTNGNELWVKRYNGPTGDACDEASALAVDGLGNVYVTGTSSGTDNDYATIKYDPDGNELWVKRYNGPGNSGDNACALAVDGLGNVYVTGSGTNGYINYDYTTIKYTPDGSELWVKCYSGLGDSFDEACALAVDSLGNVYVTGYSRGSGTGQDYTTIKYDTDGNQLWVKHYNGPGNSGDEACALAVDSLGNVYVTGGSTGSGTGCDYATIKYSQRNYCTQILEGDLNSDCKVDITDFAILAQQWLDPFDLTDFATLAEDWLECKLAYQGACW